MVNTDTLEWAKKAQDYLKQAEKTGRTERRTTRQAHNALPADFYTKQEVKYYLLAAEAFRVCGEHHWFDSAKAYGRAATIQADSLHDAEGSARMFVEAGIVMEKVDTNFANEYYRKAISQFCHCSKYNSAAFLQERLADNFRKKCDNAVAIEEYQRASQLYCAAKMTDQSDRTLERAAYLLGDIEKHRDSSQCYLSLAIRMSHENTKKFNIPAVMLRAIVLLLHDCLMSKSNDLSEVVAFLEQMYDLDCRFSESQEHELIVDITQCVKRGDLNAFVDCVYSFNAIFEFDELLMTALHGIKKYIAAKSSGGRTGEPNK